MFEKLFNFMFNKEVVNKNTKTIKGCNREIKGRINENKKSSLINYFKSDDKKIITTNYDFIYEQNRISRLQSFRSC